VLWDRRTPSLTKPRARGNSVGRAVVDLDVDLHPGDIEAIERETRCECDDPARVAASPERGEDPITTGGGRGRPLAESRIHRRGLPSTPPAPQMPRVRPPRSQSRSQRRNAARTLSSVDGARNPNHRRCLVVFSGEMGRHIGGLEAMELDDLVRRHRPLLGGR
jgi:hypothetical protein